MKACGGNLGELEREALEAIAAGRTDAPPCEEEMAQLMLAQPQGRSKQGARQGGKNKEGERQP